MYFFDTSALDFEHILMPEKVEKIWNVQKAQVIDFILKEESVYWRKTNERFHLKWGRETCDMQIRVPSTEKPYRAEV